MGTAFTLLITEEDWPKYREMYAQAAGFAPNQVGWSTGPVAYPCLVASFTEKGSVLLSAKKVLSCYVYVSDAQKLLETAQMKSAEPRLGAVVPSQANFNKAMMAHIMTIVDALVRTSIVKKDQYETWFAKMLAKADQLRMEDMESIVRSICGDEMPDDDDDEPEENSNV